MEPQYRIAFLGYKSLSDIVKRVLQKPEFKDSGTYLVDCLPDNINEMVNDCLSKGCEIFIAGSSNAAEFRRRFKLPLIEMSLLEIDYMAAIKKALSIGERPIIAYYRYSQQPNMSKFEYLLDTQIISLSYEDVNELREHLRASDADVVIGSSLVMDITAGLGKRGVLLYAGEQTVADALTRAQHRLASLNKNLRYNAFTRTMIQNIPVGIISLTAENDIFIFNDAAERITGVPYARARMQKVESLFPELAVSDALSAAAPVGRSIKNNSVELFAIPVEDSGKRLGTLLLLKPQNSGADAEAQPDRRTVPENRFEDIFGSSYAISKARIEAKRLIENRSSLIITGPIGSGKHLFAHSIASAWGGGVPLSVNCGALQGGSPSEFFFGYSNEEGVHPGITDMGVSTIILDNIWEATPAVQSCLLAIIQHSVLPGFNKMSTRHSILNIITIVPTGYMAAVKKNLRKELFYALSAFILNIPPLARRQDDVIELFDIFVADYMRRYDYTPAISASLKQILLQYTWPGNVSELRNVCNRFSAALRDTPSPSISAQRRALIEAIGEDELFSDLMRNSDVPADALSKSPEKLAGMIATLKSVYFMSNEAVAAMLGISRTTLWRIMKQEK